ncbi:hypothetical protein BsWGS_02479 [Bradybaena similaris]
MSGVHSEVFKSWEQLTSALGTTAKVRDDWWSIIERRYSEEWRFYHTLTHIEHLLQLYNQWRERIAELENMLLSIFFHDIVYDPAASDNELRSIEVFTKFALDAGLADNVVQRVARMITATITHSTEDRQDDLDLRLFLDFDLAVLGQDAEAYKQYAEDIRKEYIHFDDETYRKGRCKVLKSLLSLPSLYATDELQEEYEEQARNNITGEITTLEA